VLVSWPLYILFVVTFSLFIILQLWLERKRLLKLIDLSQKLILLYQLKYMNIGFDDSKVVILICKIKNV